MGFLTFVYPFELFIVFVAFMLIFAIETIYFAYLFFIVSRKHGIRELEILSYSFGALGFSSILVVFGFIYFYYYGTTETPLDLGFIRINFLFGYRLCIL